MTFSTTTGGVILGYQNVPAGQTTTDYVPALYVGTDGRLYAEIWDGAVNPIQSPTLVNDGQPHHAVLIVSNDTESLYLDGVLVGGFHGPVQPVDLTYDQLDTGLTPGWPAGNGGYDPFVGTLSSVQISTGSTLPGSVTFAGSSNQIDITPPTPGTYSIGFQATDKVGGTSATPASLFLATKVPITVSVGSNVVIAQGSVLSRTGSFTDPPGDGPWTATVNYGDGSGVQPLSLNKDNTFSLGHTYANAGFFAVTVTVTDGLTVSGQNGFLVTVSGFTVNNGSPQQSMVRSLTYTFANPTQVERRLRAAPQRQAQQGEPQDRPPQPDGMTYLITFSGASVVGGSLPDGNYTLITLHNKVHVLSGPPMTQDDVNTFVRLFGDANGDGVVNAADKALLEQAEANPSSEYAPDFEYDGKPRIEKTDIAQFNKRLGRRIQPPAKAPAKFAGRMPPILSRPDMPRRRRARQAGAGVRSVVRLVNPRINRHG